MARYVITAYCNPYHSRCFHHGEEVVKRDGATPVKWIHKEFSSLKEANEELFGYLCNVVADSPVYYPMPFNWGLAVARLGDSEFNVRSFGDGTKSFQDDVVTYSTEVL